MRKCACAAQATLRWQKDSPSIVRVVEESEDDDNHHVDAETN